MNYFAKIIMTAAMAALLSCACFGAVQYTDTQGVTYTLDEATQTACVGGTDSVNNTSGYTGNGDVVIPASITAEDVTYTVNEIEAFAFSGSDVQSISIPATVATIGYSAFSSCEKLAEITVDVKNTAFCSFDGDLYSKDKTQLYAFADGNARKTFDVPDNVTEILPGAFEGTVKLKGVNLNNVQSAGEFAFANSSVESAICVGSVVADGAFAGSSVKNVAVLSSALERIGRGAFAGCTSLETVILPSTGIVSDDAFYGCENLGKIIFCSSAATAMTFGENVFEGVPDTCSIIYRAGMTGFETSVGSRVPVTYSDGYETLNSGFSNMLAVMRSFVYVTDTPETKNIAFSALNKTNAAKTVKAFVAFYTSDGKLVDVKITSDATVMPYASADLFVTATDKEYSSYSIILLNDKLSPVGISFTDNH